MATEANDELKLAWQLVERTGCNIFLTGKAGTGKTTFLKELKANSPKRMVVLAPTGIAAINAGGTTIHSFFQLPLSPYVPGASFGGRESKKYQFGKIKRNIIRTLDLLVIDEVSMVRADLLDAVDSVMRRYRKHNEPFGGAQLLLIGDLQQLAPVVKDDEWELMKEYYDTPYFFSSRALAMTNYQTVELTKVYRQQDDNFVRLLNRIRENKADDNTLNMLNARYIPNFKIPAGGNYIRLTTHNYQAQRINERKLAELPSAPFDFTAEVTGDFPESSFPADATLTLKTGAQVMFIKNDTAGRFFNGMIGEVDYVEENSIGVRNRDTGEVINIEKAEWTNSKYTLDSKTKEITETVEGVFRQYPLRLAWAITIHKSQGLTFEHAIIDASHSFAHGQTYVALSRCRSLEGMVLSAPLSRESVINDETVDSFIRQATAEELTEEAVNRLETAYVAKMLDELFDFAPLHRSMEEMTRLLSEHFFNKYHLLLTEYTKALKDTDNMQTVAKKFATQYRNILDTGHNANDTVLQERIHKGAAYFLEQLDAMKPLLQKTNIATGDKELKKRFDERKAAIADEMLLKTGLLEYESREETLFSTNDMLRKKAAILLGNDEGKQGKPKKEESKRRKTDAKTRKAALEERRKVAMAAAVEAMKAINEARSAAHETEEKD